MRKSDVAAFFDTAAARYDRDYDASTPAGHMLRARLDAVVRLVGDGRGSVLDAGMGPGRLCEELLRRGWTVSGVDVSAEMVAIAQQRLPAAGDRLLQASIEQLPFPDNSFDAVVATGVLEYVADVRAALAELRRVLSPGGLAVISYPNTQALYAVWYGRVFSPVLRALAPFRRRARSERPQRLRPLPRLQVAPTLSAAGFTIETVKHTSCMPAISPLELLFPQAIAALARRLEPSGRGTRRLATQLVIAGR